MYNFTVPMALMDFVPVVFFGVSAVLLLRDLYDKMFKGAYALLAAGSVNVFMAGFCKALWKLLYAANICDFVVLEQMFMPVNSLGLLFVGLSVVGMLIWKRKGAMLSVAPVAFTSSMPFIMMMVVGLGGLCAGLSVVAAKMKKGKVMILFILSFACSMAMGYGYPGLRESWFQHHCCSCREPLFPELSLHPVRPVCQRLPHRRADGEV